MQSKTLHIKSVRFGTAEIAGTTKKVMFFTFYEGQFICIYIHNISRIHGIVNHINKEIIRAIEIQNKAIPFVQLWSEEPYLLEDVSFEVEVELRNKTRYNGRIMVHANEVYCASHRNGYRIKQNS